MSGRAIRVDVWSDVACPWCYLGTRRLQQAVDLRRSVGSDVAVEVVHRSFELVPDASPDDDVPEVEFLAAHLGRTREQAERLLADVSAVAAEVGLAYDMAAVRHCGTRRAHEVLHLARLRGVQPAMVERLFAAHFVEGRHVGRVDDLVALAAEVGLDADEVRETLRTRRFAYALDADRQQGRAAGVSSVPFAVFDGRYAVVGAQPVSAYAEVIATLERERLVR